MKYKRLGLQFGNRAGGTFSEPVFRVNCDIPANDYVYVALEAAYISTIPAATTNNAYVKIGITNTTIDNSTITAGSNADSNVTNDNCLGRVGIYAESGANTVYSLNAQYNSYARPSDEATNLIRLPAQLFKQGMLNLKLTQGDATAGVDTSIVTTTNAKQDNYHISLGLYY